MTVRETIQRKMRAGWTVAIISFIALIAGDVFLSDSRWAWLVAIPSITFVATCIYFYWFIQCPRCHASFGPFAVWSVTSQNFCPHCGVHFDQPAGGP
jgi:hypothetical protein